MQRKCTYSLLVHHLRTDLHEQTGGRRRPLGGGTSFLPALALLTHYGQIAFTYEAAIQAVSASAFINPGGLFSIGRSTVRQVAISMGRAGAFCLNMFVIYRFVLLRQEACGSDLLLQVNPKKGGKRATQETIRCARLCHEALSYAFEN
eukprot:768448-Hanusia_phi.AAC.5